MPVGIQYSHGQSKQAHEEDIGKDDLAKRYRQLECLGELFHPTWCNDPYEEGCKNNTQNREDGQESPTQCQGDVGQFLRFFL